MNWKHKFAWQLWRDTGGSAAALFAVSLPPLLATTAVAIDFGQMYAAERDLQSIADAAAAAAVDSSDIPATAKDTVADVIAQSATSGIEVQYVTPGFYTRDPSIGLDERFAAGDEDANAVEVELIREVDFLVAGAFLDIEAGKVRAFSRAAKTEMVAFELNTKAVSISAPVVEGFLSGLLGTDIDLSDDAIDALLSQRLDILKLAGNLKLRVGNPDLSFGEVFASELPLADVLEAMASSTTDPDLRDALLDMAREAGDRRVVLEDVIDLGPYGSLNASVDGDSVYVDAYSLLRATLEISGGEGYDFDLGLDMAGAASVDLRVAGGRGFQRSPWLTISEAYDVILRTGQTRIYAETAANVPGAGKLRLPLYTEIAPAEAQISRVVCAPDDADNGVTIDTRPSLGNLSFADVPLDKFSDFDVELNPTPAKILDTKLVKVTAFSDVDLGGNQTVSVHLSLDEIERQVRKEAGTQDLLETTIASLLGNAEIEVKTLGIGLGTSMLGLDGSITDLLGDLTPQLDGLLNQVTQAAGVKLGVAEVGVVRLECGVPTIVA